MASRAYHTIYLTIIGLLLFVWALSNELLQTKNGEMDIRRMVVLPFMSVPPTPNTISQRLNEDVLRSIVESSPLHAFPADKVLPDGAEFENHYASLKYIDDSLVLIAYISGPDESLHISAQVIDTRNMKIIWSDRFVTNVYDLARISEQLSTTVVSLASS